MKKLKLEKLGAMSMKENEKWKNIDCITLTSLESQQINGGTLGFWQDLTYLAGRTVLGLAAFGTEGGRNAGISVR